MLGLAAAGSALPALSGSMPALSGAMPALDGIKSMMGGSGGPSGAYGGTHDSGFTLNAGVTMGNPKPPSQNPWVILGLAGIAAAVYIIAKKGG